MLLSNSSQGCWIKYKYQCRTCLKCFDSHKGWNTYKVLILFKEKPCVWDSVRILQLKQDLIGFGALAARMEAVARSEGGTTDARTTSEQPEMSALILVLHPHFQGILL